MKIYPWIIGALALVIIWLLLTRPDPPDNIKAQYEDTVRFLKAKEASIIAQEERIIQRSKDASLHDSLALASKEREIQALKGRTVKTRVIVQHVIDSVPDLRLFVAQQDSIIQIQGTAIDTLKASVEFQRKLFDDLVVSHQAERDISQRIEDEQWQYIAKLEKQVKKTNRGQRWLRAAAVIGTIAGFLFGAQL